LWPSAFRKPNSLKYFLVKAEISTSKQGIEIGDGMGVGIDAACLN
jgi:hypothetical protein